MKLKPLNCFSLFQLIALSIAVFAISGCDGEDAVILEDCEGIPYSDQNENDSVDIVISAFIDGNEIHCYDEEYIDGVEVVVIDYGNKQDCPSGCITSSICGIINSDTNEPFIYSARWEGSEEVPQTLDASCLSSGFPQGNSISDCAVQPSGYTHPITESEEFRNLIEDENSMFSDCK